MIYLESEGSQLRECKIPKKFAVERFFTENELHRFQRFTHQVPFNESTSHFPNNQLVEYSSSIVPFQSECSNIPSSQIRIQRPTNSIFEVELGKTSVQESPTYLHRHEAKQGLGIKMWKDTVNEDIVAEMLQIELEINMTSCSQRFTKISSETCDVSFVNLLHLSITENDSPSSRARYLSYHRAWTTTTISKLYFNEFATLPDYESKSSPSKRLQPPQQPTYEIADVARLSEIFFDDSVLYCLPMYCLECYLYLYLYEVVVD
jgi:hypothetical protein